jgi:signal transduction histidine kinase
MGSVALKRLEWTLPILGSAALLLAALILIPMGWLFYVSIAGSEGGFTLANFAALVRDPEMLRPLLLSLGVAFAVSLACAVVAAPLAWLVARTDLPGKRIVRMLVMASFVTPPFLGAVAWEILAAPNSGLLNEAYRLLLDLPRRDHLFNIYSVGGLIFVLATYTFPYVFILVTNGLERLPRELEEASAILGARRLRTVWRITIPLALPALLAGTLVAFLQAMNNFGAPAIIAIPARLETVTTRIWELFQFPPQPGLAAAAAVPLLAVTIEAGGRPAGRVILANPRKRFTARDLRWLEQIIRTLGPPLENVFLLRHLRARAVEAERSRISRDLHDGILQTLLSLKIQLDVLRKKVSQAPEQTQTELGNLQKMVQQESDELRRMVTDLRPLRVESADLRELMVGFAERFRNESGLAVDLFIDDRNLRLPDRICRELFQIYRESLNNVKKHANASHVVVKLEQDEAKVLLVIDDNGLGFSFSGQFASEELDRLRLGPISIKERTRTVGGTLTVESNPGHGARLTVEIPLN